MLDEEVLKQSHCRIWRAGSIYTRHPLNLSKEQDKTLHIFVYFDFVNFRKSYDTFIRKTLWNVSATEYQLSC